MSTIGDIRDGLRNRLEQAGIRAYAVPPANFTGNELPAAIVSLVNARYDTTYGGSPLSGEIIVTAVVASGENDEGYTALDDFLSPTGDKSLVTVLEEDPSLGLDDVSIGVLGFQNSGFRSDLNGMWAADIIVAFAKRS